MPEEAGGHPGTPKPQMNDAQIRNSYLRQCTEIRELQTRVEKSQSELTAWNKSWNTVKHLFDLKYPFTTECNVTEDATDKFEQAPEEAAGDEDGQIKNILQNLCGVVAGLQRQVQALE
eukprot:gene3076-3502_t